MGKEKLMEKAWKEANSSMYVALLNNTKGESKEMVKKNKTERAFESYRYIMMKGNMRRQWTS